MSSTWVFLGGIHLISVCYRFKPLFSHHSSLGRRALKTNRSRVGEKRDRRVAVLIFALRFTRSFAQELQKDTMYGGREYYNLSSYQPEPARNQNKGDRNKEPDLDDSPTLPFRPPLYPTKESTNMKTQRT